MDEQMTQVKVEVQGTYDDRFRAVYDVLERQLNNGDDIGSAAAVFIDGNRSSTYGEATSTRPVPAHGSATPLSTLSRRRSR